MKCIDAIEGTVKSILQQLHGLCVSIRHLDDTEYVRNVKAVIDATQELFDQQSGGRRKSPAVD